eukprot:TRINITY_DN63459_c0_g2_i5.p1 TRINITY_DN63459_c0_g2~~TRINITY_DN63459_c0_g2_i5.p1  ORF type:complete len:178 (-),score=29.10 TRINITY_DN63459_c0_g2_i5:87-620(-)
MVPMSTVQTEPQYVRGNVTLTEQTQREDDDKETSALPTSVAVVSVRPCITTTMLVEADTDIMLDFSNNAECYIDLKVTRGKVIKLRFNKHSGVNISAWQNDKGKRHFPDLQTTPQLPVSHLDEGAHTVGIFIWSNNVVALLKQLSSNLSMVSMNFTAVGRSDVPKMRVRPLSPNLGE